MTNNKNYPVGENRLAGQDFKQGNIDDELAQDCKHKEIIKGANEEGNEKTQVGQINQWSGNKVGGVKTIDMRAHGT